MRSFTMVNVAKPFLLACNESTTFFPKFVTPHSHPKIAAAAAAAATTLNNRKRVLPLRCKSLSLSLNGDLLEVPKEIDDEEEFIVVNFYRFVFIEDPEAEVSKHLSFMEGRDIHGRIYLNEQGINAQYSGPNKDALAYVNWVRQDSRFSDVLVQISPASNGHAFPRLKLRYKPSLVQLEGGISHLPLLDPSMRAAPLAPSEWRKRLEAVNNTNNSSHENFNPSCILLDVRNGYEWDVGHFQGAQRPDVDCFRATSFGQSESEVLAVYC